MQISQEPTIPTTPADSDVLAIESNGITYSVSKSTLATAILGSSFIRKSYSYQYTVAASSSVSVTGANLGVSTPTGYVPIAVRDVNTNSGGVVVRGLLPHNTGSDSVVELRNVSTGEVTRTLSLSIIYAKAETVTVVS